MLTTYCLRSSSRLMIVNHHRSIPLFVLYQQSSPSDPLWSRHKWPNQLPWQKLPKWIMWRSSAVLAPCLLRLIWTFTSSQSPPSFSVYSMASSSSWPSTQLDDQPSSSMFSALILKTTLRDEWRRATDQADEVWIARFQPIYCNILSKIVFLVILDWPLHWTQFSIGQIRKINWSAALTEFSVPR